MSHLGEPAIFSLNASRRFGEAASAHLGIPLSPHEEHQFEHGEHKAWPLVSVRDKDVFVIQSLYADRERSIHDKLCQLLFFSGALRDASCGRLTIVMPYLCYGRHDRKTNPRDPVTTRYVAALFEAMQVDRAVTMDVHNPAAFQNAWRLRTDHLEAKMLFVRHFQTLGGHDEIVVLSPDIGGAKRAETFRLALGRMLNREIHGAFLEKYRKNGVITGQALTGDISGKAVIIIDDMISTGTTLVRAAEACRAHGAIAVYGVASHGLFSGKSSEILNNSALDSIVVTNSALSSDMDLDQLHRKLTLIDVAPLFSEAIRRIHSGGSIVELIDR